MEAESYLDDYNPETYEEAINSKDSTNWKKVMESEMNSLSENHTWELSDLPVGAKAIPCFSQRQGIDYSETYSPVAKLGTIRTVLSIAAEERMHLTQFDVSTAFLYGDLEETIFMKQPEGFKDGSGRVCKLKRSLYVDLHEFFQVIFHGSEDDTQFVRLFINRE
ncbi:retrovirus-related Pol polyprotein from transposon TNT 1-94 [Trichonephila clavipes]|nr:retrovirus-related Pol polyprotein from transposon TNT 1-94 [Trichonephila clavipes]